MNKASMHAAFFLLTLTHGNVLGSYVQSFRPKDLKHTFKKQQKKTSLVRPRGRRISLKIGNTEKPNIQKRALTPINRRTLAVQQAKVMDRRGRVVFQGKRSAPEHEQSLRKIISLKTKPDPHIQKKAPIKKQSFAKIIHEMKLAKMVQEKAKRVQEKTQASKKERRKEKTKQLKAEYEFLKKMTFLNTLDSFQNDLERSQIIIDKGFDMFRQVKQEMAEHTSDQTSPIRGKIQRLLDN